jgi:hypothetical protein
MIRVTVRYDERLQRITGEKEHPVVMNEGAGFLFLLQCVFIEYPQIENEYAPGMLCFAINGKPPKAHSMLRDGDEVFFEAAI